jgi:UDP-N-acetylglucosamine diphosphorylase/glucosamine-1-phosphate N-acetyltransferase
MKVIIYEKNTENFYPLTNLFPQFNLRIGMKSIAENIKYYFAKLKVDYICRDVFRFKEINPKGPAMYISGQCIITEKFDFPKEEVKFLIGSKPAGFIKYKPPFPKNLKEIDKVLKSIKKTKKLPGFILNNFWDLIKYNEPMLIHHFKMKKGKSKTLTGIYIIGNKKNVYVAKDAVIHNLVCIDASAGPVYIDKGAVIRPFTTIIGPSYIGRDTIIERAKIIKSSIGPVCRVGGEVEACIFQGYSNKYHEGFIGHSFIGEWVNLGALTTNSDIKNNYGSVKVLYGKKRIDSGMIKLGCFIGDHTKIGIGTLIPTGAVISSFVNFFGGGMMPGFISCFKWLTAEKQEDYKLEKAITTAKIVMKRRNIKMSKQYEDLIRMNYKWRNLL